MYWTEVVDCHCENEVSSGENGEVNEEDSDYKPDSESDSESDETSTEDDDDSPPYLQEESDDSKSVSDNEEADETFNRMSELQEKKLSEIVLE